MGLGVVVTSPQAMRAQALGIGLAWAPGRSAYVPLGHSSIDRESTFIISDVQSEAELEPHVPRLVVTEPDEWIDPAQLARCETFLTRLVAPLEQR